MISDTQAAMDDLVQSALENEDIVPLVMHRSRLTCSSVRLAQTLHTDLQNAVYVCAEGVILMANTSYAIL